MRQKKFLNVWRHIINRRFCWSILEYMELYYKGSQQEEEGFTDSDWNKLMNSQIIPIKNKIPSDKCILVKPCDCFFKFGEERYVIFKYRSY